MDLFEYEVVDAGNLNSELHNGLVQDRFDLRLEDLLYHQRNGNELIGLHLLKGPHQQGRCRRLAQPIDRSPIAERIDKFRHEAVHVGHRKHRHHLVLVRSRTVLLAVLNRRAEVPISQHDPLRVARRAGSVVDHGQIVHIVGRIDHVLRPESVGILFRKQVVHVLPSPDDFVLGTIENRPSVDVHHKLHIGHILDIQPRPLVRARKQSDTVGMMDQVLDALVSEIRQNRNNHSFIGVYGHVGHAPPSPVPGTERDMIAFLQTDFVKKQVKLLDLGRHLPVGEGLSVDRVQR